MSGGGKFLAGLGMIAASSVASKPRQEIEPLPADYQKLSSYYCSVFKGVGIHVPKDFPGYLPFEQYSCTFNVRYRNKNVTTWEDLAAFHKTSVAEIKKLYLKWCCERDRIPFDEHIFSMTGLSKNWESPYTVRANNSGECFIKYMEPEETKLDLPSDPNPHIASLYRFADGSYHLSETNDPEPEIEAQKKSAGIPQWVIFFDDTLLVWFFIAICVFLPFVLASYSCNPALLLGLLLVVPIVIFRYKAKNYIHGTNNSFLSDLDSFLCFLISTPTGLLILFMLALPIIAAIISAAWGID